MRARASTGAPAAAPLGPIRTTRLRQVARLWLLGALWPLLAVGSLLDGRSWGPAMLAGTAVAYTLAASPLWSSVHVRDGQLVVRNGLRTWHIETAAVPGLRVKDSSLAGRYVHVRRGRRHVRVLALGCGPVGVPDELRQLADTLGVALTGDVD